MEVIRSIVIGGDILMAAIMRRFPWKNVRDVASLVRFFVMIFLFLLSAGLTWWRWP